MSAGSGRAGRRLFFSLWPSAEFQNEVAQATAQISDESGGRIIPARNFHVTLLFLGEVLEPRLPAIQLAGAAVSGVSPFTLSFDRVEVWDRSRVLVLTPSSVPAQLIRLANDLRDRLRDDASHDEHEYRPHLTIARDLPRARPTQSIMPLTWNIDDFVLVESRRGPAGSEYSVLARWPLQEPAGLA